MSCDIKQNGNTIPKEEITNEIATDEEMESFEAEERICRLCCAVAKYSLYSRLYDEPLLYHINMSCDIIVLPSDKFPKWLCRTCLRYLKSAIRLRQMSRLSNEKLIRYKRDQKVKEPDQEKLDTSVKCEFDVGTTWDNSDTDICDVPSPIADALVMKQDEDPEVFKSSNTETDSWKASGKIRVAIKPVQETVSMCDKCGENFKHAKDYEKHSIMCSDRTQDSSVIEKRIYRKRLNGALKGPFLCEICGKELGKLQSLIVHRTTHRNVFPFQCEKCQYRGRTKDLLRVHMRTHLDVRPFACDKCPLRFLTSSNLSKHRKRHEEQTPEQCSQCGKKFANKLSLSRHVNDIHIGAPPAYCDICGKRFSRQKNLCKHRLKAHNIKSQRSGRWPSYLLCTREETHAVAVTDQQQA